MSFNRFFLVLTAAYGIFSSAEAALPSLSPAYYSWLGTQIYDKECNGINRCLTHWNAGEDFPSLGIGHFIWYRAGQQDVFEETFPQLLDFMALQGASLPHWLADPLQADNPWPSREAFYADFDHARLRELRELLAVTQGLQAAFIVQRFEQTAADIIAASPRDERTQIENALYSVANDRAPLGIYALIDYLHFKGSGLNQAERYQQQGWGLLQVLQAMSGQQSGLDSFAQAAEQVLTRRVSNAPPQRDEARWLTGWINRVRSYTRTELPIDLAR